MSTLYEAFNDTYNQLPVKLYKHNLQGKCIWSPIHWHRSIELFVAFEGRIHFNCGSHNFSFAEDDWMIVNSSELHSSRYVNPNDHFRGISILFSLPFIENWLGKGLFLFNPRNMQITNQIKTIAASIYDSDPASPHYNLRLMSKVYELLFIIANDCIKENTSYTIPFADDPSKATEFIDYIEHHYKENIGLKQIAEHFKYSSSYFSRFFKEVIGINYYTYLNFVRAHHAADELLKNHATLTECALNNGFPNTKSFITMFKKLYGCTPGQFLSTNL